MALGTFAFIGSFLRKILKITFYDCIGKKKMNIIQTVFFNPPKFRMGPTSPAWLWGLLTALLQLGLELPCSG